MSLQIFENETTVLTKTRLSVVELEANLHIYRMTSTAEKVSATGPLTVDVKRKIPDQSTWGFVDDENLEKLKAGGEFSKRNLHYLSKHGQELFRTQGWGAWDDKQLLGLREDVFEHITANPDLDTIVNIKYDSNMLMDRNGDPLPVALHFDYISHGGITDGRYDLKLLAAHLLTRDDVWIYPNQGGWRKDDVDRTKRATTVEECITEIPYYNRERGSAQTVYFRWMPTLEAYRKMWANCGGKYPSTDMHQAIFDLDLLGLRACGAALFDDYHRSTRYDNCGND
jgi:hypothetical protein